MHPKTSEMNELDRGLSNACLNFKIGSVVLKLQLVKLGNKNWILEKFHAPKSPDLMICCESITKPLPKPAHFQKIKKFCFDCLEKTIGS